MEYRPVGNPGLVGASGVQCSLSRPSVRMLKAKENGDMDSDVTVSLLDMTKLGRTGAKKTKKEKNFKTKDKTKTTGILGLFRYGKCSDICLMLVGLLFSIVTGAALPCLGLVFGGMTNIFMDVTKRGFKNSTLNNESLPYPGLMNSSLFNASGGGHDDRLTLEEFLNYMNTYAFYYLCIGISAFTASFLQTLFWEIACERQVHRLRNVFLSQVLRQDVSWYDQNEQGDLNAKLSDDIERIREGIGNKFAMVIQYLTTFISGILVGLYVDWLFTCTLMVVGPFMMSTAGFMAKLAAASAQREQLKYSFASGIATEVLGCIRTVAAFGGQQREIDRYGKALNDGRKLAMKKYYVFSTGLFLVNFILYSGYGFGFWMACHYIATGYSTPGSVFTVLFSVMMGAFSLGNILPFVNSVSIAIGVARNVFKIVDRIPLIDPYSEEGIVPTDMEGHVLLKNVSFAYPTRNEVQVLSGLGLEIKPGQTVAIVGSSGAGKSTIANLLMRFYDPTAGQIIIDGRNIRDLNLRWLRSNIGLVSQEPVLFGVSILDNIRYGRKNVSIEEVKAAASLGNAHSFISELPKGYETLVGDRGAQLSGGQKQRIAIARALVKQPKILLLDEATSALDSQSEGVVQEALENAMRGRTTVIVAHRLSTIRNADLIYVMKEGKVVESGNHDTLMDLKGTYYQLVTTQIQEEKDKEMFLDAEHQEESQKNELEHHKVSAVEIRHMEDDGISEPIEKMESTMGRLLQLNVPEWYLILIGVLSCAVSGAVQPIFALFYGSIFSTFSLEASEMEEERTFWTGMFVLLGAVSGSAMWLWVLTMSSASEFLIARVRFLGMKNVLKQEISWFDFNNYSAGKIVTRLARDAPLVKHIAGLRIGQVISAMVGFITALTIAFFFGWKLALLLLAAVPIVVYGGYQQVSLSKRHAFRDLSLMDNAGKVALECIQNLKTVQALGREAEFTDLYMEYLILPFKESKKQAVFYALIFAISQGAVYFMYSIAFKFGSKLIADGEMVPVDVYRVFFALAFSAVAIGQGSAYLQDYAKGVTSSKLVLELIDKRSKANPLDESGLKPSIKGNLKFSNVCFSYPTRKNVQVLENFNLEIKDGETVALVGMSGCGKSTVISLLEQFYSIDRGEILVDGININSINLSYLRSQMGLVTQEPALFDCTIRENILYGRIAQGIVPTHQQVIDAAKMANIHEFISCLPQGYDTLCGDRGTQLSGGQKQRIAIARALIRDPKILLLDEATSALDTENEKIVQKALDRARMGRTSIVVAHRLSTIQNADKIAVIHKGRIVELGKHEELKSKKGIYHELIKRQQL